MSISKQNALIEIRHLSMETADRQRLENLNFELYAGETHVLLSTYSCNHQSFMTLLKGGLQDKLVSFSGEMRLLGKKYVPEKELQISLQFVQTETSVFDTLSPAKNIMFGKLRGFGRTESRATTDCCELLKELNIQLDIRKPMSQMSYDELKIIELLRCYVMKPSIVVLHNVTELMSAQGRAVILLIVNRLKKQGCGVLYLTSSYEEALFIGDRISLLDNSTIKQTFLSETIRCNPECIAGYLSGWAPLTAGGSEDAKVMESILSIDNTLHSNRELKQLLGNMTKDICRALRADETVIYLMNQSVMRGVDLISSAGMDREEELVLSTESLFLLLGEETPRILESCDSAFQTVFPQSTGIKTIAFMPVHTNGGNIALLQVNYGRRITFDNDRKIYLRAFSREISMVIETSNLLGNSTLIQESHHRIKNNLQIVYNLLDLQRMDAEFNTNVNIEEVLSDAMKRVKAIAFVHTLLSRDGRGHNSINLKNMIRMIVTLYSDVGISIEMDLEDVTISYGDAVSLSLVVNELISNSVKHAFPEAQQNKKIAIHMHNTGLMVSIEVSDNGKNPYVSTDSEYGGVGTEIIESILCELNCEYCRSPNHIDGCGTRVCISMKRLGKYTVNVFNANE